jgi:hypothetical protein
MAAPPLTVRRGPIVTAVTSLIRSTRHATAVAARVWRRAGHDVPVAEDAAQAVRNAHMWFENNSGWAPPDADTLAEWLADGVCRCPDECLVAPAGWCEHGLASWGLILSALEQTDGR